MFSRTTKYVYFAPHNAVSSIDGVRVIVASPLNCDVSFLHVYNAVACLLRAGARYVRCPRLKDSSVDRGTTCGREYTRSRQILYEFHRRRGHDSDSMLILYE